MILHTVAFIAFLVNDVSAAPIVVQCAPTGGQDPLWSRLLVASIPSILALVVAWMAFRWNSQKDQKRWVLDNKKAEWKEMMEFASAVEQFMPSVAIGLELKVTVHDPLFKKHLRDMTQASLKCVFISADKAMRMYEMLLSVQLANEKSKGQIEDFESNAPHAKRPGFPTPVQAAEKVRDELAKAWREIRRLASDDLEIERRKPWWRAPTAWLEKVRGTQTEHKTPSI